MLTDAQLETYARTGVVRLEAAVADDVAAGVADQVWQHLARRGIDRADPGSWPSGRLDKLQSLVRADVYGPLLASVVPGVADPLLGEGAWTEPTRPQGLVTFPDPGPWHLPHKVWHLDVPARGPVDPPAAVRLLGVVEPVAPRAGATLVVEGSHQLVTQMVLGTPDGDAGRSSDVRRRLAREHEWFGALFAPGDDREQLLEPSACGGVTVRVAELTGDPGDVWVMHPWTLHGLSPNASPNVRSMCTHTVLGAAQRFYGG